MTPQEVKKQKLTDIFYALMELGRDKPIMDIGVAELCRNAKVSRTYYYKRFSSFEQIITDYEFMKMSKYLRELPNRQTIKTSELMKHYFQMVSLDKEMQIGMSETANTDLLISAFKTTQMYLAKVGIIGKIRGSLSNVNQSYWDDFLSGAVVNVSLKWLNDGMKESPEYMGKLIASFVSHQDAIG